MIYQLAALLARFLPRHGPSADQLADMLSPFRHSQHIRRHRAKLIASRVAFVSAIFGILTPAWIIIDALAFPWPVWGHLALVRIGATMAFAVLATLKIERLSLPQAYTMLATMLAIPPLFFLLSHPILSGLAGGGLTEVVARAYLLLPIIVIAGLCVFPLTLFEVGAFSLPVLAAIAGSYLLAGPVALSEVVQNGWLILIVLGIAAFSGMSQLHYMVALINQATRDALTNAFTRRSGEETLDLQFRLAERTGVPLVVGFLDVDKFKSVNDQFGHEQGDAVLKSVANALRNCLRKNDVLVRWGGEEFVVILPNTDTEGLATVMDRMASSGLGMRPDGIPVTASMGLAERGADGVEDWDQLIQIADDRMYEAKTSGRNKVVGPNPQSSRSELIPGAKIPGEAAPPVPAI